MDYKLNRPLMLCVLALMLLEVQWSLVCAAPTDRCKSELESAKKVTDTLEYEANKLLQMKPMVCDGCSSDSDDVPAATVSGVSVSEQLQDIYTKAILFRFHILKVHQYQQYLFTHPQEVQKQLTDISNRLEYLFGLTKNILRCIDSEGLQLTTPAPLQLSHDNGSEKKKYGYGVLVRLREWLQQVRQVLEKVNSDDE